ncbi:hypothetical protein FLONG3_9535 [Fusarium longipes]|uniref:Uncharacterized protein n=1 Tax=Fusarium longipes TaxID=694270 RepID=A0A395RWS3_9HYPO|nr:hypothetical protein FLONG3_9535 [Fusarium longipes]
MSEHRPPLYQLESSGIINDLSQHEERLRHQQPWSYLDEFGDRRYSEDDPEVEECFRGFVPDLDSTKPGRPLPRIQDGRPIDIRSCDFDPVTARCASHEDYGLSPERFRQYGKMPAHKELAVSCLICMEVLPKFRVICEYCEWTRQRRTQANRNQEGDTIEPRWCIICRCLTEASDTIFCEEHMKTPARFNIGEQRMLEQSGVCKACWRRDAADERKTCRECRMDRKEKETARRKTGVEWPHSQRVSDFEGIWQWGRGRCVVVLDEAEKGEELLAA